MIKIVHKIFIAVILLIALKFCCPKNEAKIVSTKLISSKALVESTSPYSIEIKNNVVVESYFKYLDSIIKIYDSFTPYKLTEHLLVRANPWIIDTLKNTDYYRMMVRDSFVYNQKKDDCLA